LQKAHRVQSVARHPCVVLDPRIESDIRTFLFGRQSGREPKDWKMKPIFFRRIRASAFRHVSYIDAVDEHASAVRWCERTRMVNRLSFLPDRPMTSVNVPGCTSC
jgi:hypothetical protein